MSTLYLFVVTAEIADLDNPNVPNPPQVCSDSTDSVINVDGVSYTKITSIQKMYYCLIAGRTGDITKKMIRDCINYRYEELLQESIDNELPIDITPEEAIICAKLNCGTGQFIIDTVPSYSDREQASYDYSTIVEGIKTVEKNGEREYKAQWLKSIFFAACKHIQFDLGEYGIQGMPQLCLGFLNETPANRPSLIGDSLLSKYVKDGIQGFCKGDGMTGLYDFFLGTVGSNYETNNLRTLFADSVDAPFRVTAAQWQQGGFISIGNYAFTDVDSFADYCYKWLNLGL